MLPGPLNTYARLRTEASFAEVIRAYQGAVYNTALRIAGDPGAAEDIAQNVFLGLLEAPPEALGSERAWVHRAAVNGALYWRRSGRNRLRREQAAGMPRAEAGVPAPDETLSRRELAEKALEALEDLPEDLQVAVSLRYLQGLTYEEIGATVGAPLGTVSDRVRGGLERLRSRLVALGVLGVAVSDLEEALAQVPPAAVPGTLAVSLLGMPAMVPAGGGLAVAVAGGVLSGTVKVVAGAALVLLLLLIGWKWRGTWAGKPSPGSLPSAASGRGPAMPSGVGAVADPVGGGEPAEAPPKPGIAASPAAAEAPAVLSGRVLVQESGEPVEGAYVAWMPSRWEGRVVTGTSPDQQKKGYVMTERGRRGLVVVGTLDSQGAGQAVTTDREGRYRMEVPARERGQRYALRASEGGQGYPLSELTVLPEAGVSQEVLYGLTKAPDLTEAAWEARTFPPLAPGEERVQDIPIPSSYDVLVEVLSSDGSPVSGRIAMTFVRAASQADDPPWGSRGDFEGRHEAKGIHARHYPPENARFRIELDSGHESPLEHGLSEYPRVGRRIEARLTVARALAIEGLVSYPDGSPCSEGRIHCFQDVSREEAGKAAEGGRGLLCSTFIQKDGTFRVGIPADAKGHRFFLRVDGVTDARMDAPREAAVGERVHIVLEAGGTVAGRVLDDKGVPVRKAQVRLSHGEGAYSCETDAEGRFRLKGLPRRGALAVSASVAPPGWHLPKPDWAVRWLPDGRMEETKVPVCGWTGVPVGTENLEIVLTPEGGMRPYP